ncbi:unnamed protein product [Candidula unifasciata]|uniref:F5/8 type C domain-containing protein n=1 Tax=Candidula unifasciata TaxID=100452 RepID=A0A8S3ZE80_9EUPU|nr:unnamed protein product [Candidula unifasciata]
MDFVVVKSSKHSTSQVTSYRVETGVISNAGVTYRFNRNSSDDDTFTVEFTLQMADCVVAFDQSQHTVSFGLDIASSILILNVLVTATRTQKEEVSFNVSSSVDLINSTSSKVEIDTILRLSSLSTAEGQNSILNIFVPIFAAYVSTVVTSPYKIITSEVNINNVVTLSFGPIFFTDEIHLTTILASNTSHPVPAEVTGLDTVFTMQPIADTHTTTDLAGEITYLNFSVTTTPQGSSGCALEALGMESGAIKDCQISSSPDSISGNEATEGRYNKGKGWSPFVHTGKVKEERYLQVYFGKQMLVTKIKIQQQGPAWAKELALKYSNDGLSWIPNNHTVKQEKDVFIPQASRYLRVMVSALDQENLKSNFRFEFMGCETSTEAVTELDSRVGSILGYNSEDSRLYAVSAGADSYMSSLDGIEWFSVTLEDPNKAKTLATYKPALTVPVDGDPKLNSATPDSKFTDSGYGATIDGVMKSGAIIFHWSDCCP